MKTLTSKLVTSALVLLSILNVSCKSNTSGQYTYQPPEKINDGFEVGTLEEVNIDSSLIIKAVNKIYSGKYDEAKQLLDGAVKRARNRSAKLEYGGLRFYWREFFRVYG